MVLHHRHKQRILTTITTLVIFTIALDVFLFLQPILDLQTALLYAFTVAIGLVTAYQCYNYRHSHEHLTLVNTLTQIFLGTVLFASALTMLFLQAFFDIDILDSYLYLSVLVILLTFIFLKSFDTFLESEVKDRFPMSEVPTPKSESATGRLRSEVKVTLTPQKKATHAVKRENPAKTMKFKHRGR